MMRSEYIFDNKKAAFIAHLIYGSTWAAVFFVTRLYSPNHLTGIFDLNSKIIFYSFILSLGLVTHARELIHEGNLEDHRLASNIVKIVILMAGFLDVILNIFKINLLLFPASILVLLQFELNSSIASKKYNIIIKNCVINIIYIILLVFLHDYINIPILMMGTLILFVNWFGTFNKLPIKSIAFHVRNGLSHVSSGFPLRLTLYYTFYHFGSDAVSIETKVAFSDFISIYGLVSILLSRYVLFNEKEIMNSSLNDIIKISFYCVLVTGIFGLYFYASKADYMGLTMVVLTYISRETFSPFLMRITQKERFLRSVILCILILFLEMYMKSFAVTNFAYFFGSIIMIFFTSKFKKNKEV